ncbi:bcl-2-related ovarian killer protein homolog B-like [Lingula anatina]|uniref:Bcl-2-related ovarian killer protein homolog B-like n=1 Tax=Lingula anatina TaxID=7574 RepID=A0A1S3ITI8_LINAN|nr:bcl-2-related ovarian killer protein homolog B-like [Lingula anatina]XP_013414238.1 bcl-2-related ovarian killer protein homolog B-like [Lingula anatina]|eukprot:XP_013401246.1 bcl-2-related ovarian killer protein homolog B-like [Lingula anatina]
METEKEIAEQGRTLCRDYIHNRLKRDGVASKKLGQAPEKFSDTSIEIQRIGQELEKMYPNLYSEISRQLNTTFSNEATVKSLYTDVAEQLIKNGLTWGKVVSLFALAGVFAEDCVKQGHAEFVAPLIENFVFFIERNVVYWLVEKGGWTSLIKSYQPKKDRNLFWFIGGFGALIGFTVTALVSLGL